MVRRRAAEVDELRVVAAWAEVHSTDPRRDPQQGAMLFDAPPGLDLYFADLTYEPDDQPALDGATPG